MEGLLVEILRDKGISKAKIKPKLEFPALEMERFQTKICGIFYDQWV